MVDSAVRTSAPTGRPPGATTSIDRGIPTLVPRLIAGTVILLLWEIVVRLFAPAYVANAHGILPAMPHVIVDPAFLSGGGITLAAVAEGLAIALVIGTFARPRPSAAASSPSARCGTTSTPSTRCRWSWCCRWFAVVRLYQRGAAGDRRVRRAVLDHRQRRRRRARGAAGLSRSGAVVPLRPLARAARDRAAGFDAVFPRRSAARRRPRIDRRRGRRILHRDRRASAISSSTIRAHSTTTRRSSACCCWPPSASASSFWSLGARGATAVVPPRRTRLATYNCTKPRGIACMRSMPVSVMRTISPVCTPALPSGVTTLGWMTTVIPARNGSSGIARSGPARSGG